MQIKYIAVDANQLRETLRQHPKETGLELPGAGVENNNSRTPRWRRHFLTDRTLKRHTGNCRPFQLTVPSIHA